MIAVTWVDPLLALVVGFMLVCCSCQQSTLPQYGLPSSLSRPPSLQVDGSGLVFVGAGDQLIRLDSNLVPKENLTLASGQVVVNISLSSNGSRLVVCLTDLSCAVYNATDISTGPVFSRAGALVSLQEIALFATEDSFYVGSIPEDVCSNFFLGQYGFNGSELRRREYDTSRGLFQRIFYSGFVWGSNAYYIGLDINPSNVRALRVMRVCDGTPQFSVLYEMQLRCDASQNTFGSVIGFDSMDRICGLSVMESFSTLNEPTVVVTRCRDGNANHVCVYTLAQIDSEMDRIYDKCSSPFFRSSSYQVNLAWMDTDSERYCRNFQVKINFKFYIIIHRS